MVEISHVILLLQRFYHFGENSLQSKLVNCLAQMPSYLLLQPSSDTQDSKLVPTVYFMTLYNILISKAKIPGLSSTTDEDVYMPSDSFCRLSSFMTLTLCKEVDCLVLHLLQKYPQYISIAPTSLLSCCLEHVTDERIDLASLLVKSNPFFRAKFEEDCLNIKPNCSFVFQCKKVILAYLSRVGTEKGKSCFTM